MKYIIHQKSLIGSKEKQAFFEKEVVKKIKPIKRILSGYPKLPLIEVYLSKLSPALYRVSVSLKLKSKLLYVETKGENPIQIINPLVDKLKDSVKKYLATERRERLFKRKAKREKAFAEHTHQLEKLYLEKEREQFNHLIQQLAPSLKQYALRFLKLHGKGRKTTLTTQEILDEIYLALFERFMERPSETDRQFTWSYKIANEVLTKILDKYTESTEGQIDIQNIAEQEMLSMVENYTTDAEGDLIMYEELDDISYHNKLYDTGILPDEHLLTYFEEVQETDNTFHEQVSEVLQTCDPFEKHVFELYWLDELTENEITEATGIEEQQVKAIIDHITQKIIAHLKKENLTKPFSDVDR